RLSSCCGTGVGLCLVRGWGSDRDTELLDFLLNLAEDLIKAFRVVGPIEADAGGARLKLIGPQEGRQGLRHAVEHWVGSPGSLPFRPFQLCHSRDSVGDGCRSPGAVSTS